MRRTKCIGFYNHQPSNHTESFFGIPMVYFSFQIQICPMRCVQTPITIISSEKRRITVRGMSCFSRKFSTKPWFWIVRTTAISVLRRSPILCDNRPARWRWPLVTWRRLSLSQVRHLYSAFLRGWSKYGAPGGLKCPNTTPVSVSTR